MASKNAVLIQFANRSAVVNSQILPRTIMHHEADTRGTQIISKNTERCEITTFAHQNVHGLIDKCTLT